MKKTRAASKSTVERLVGAELPHNILISGVDEDGCPVDIDLCLTDVAITIDGHCKLLSPNDQVEFQEGSEAE
jgi:hypothetical protein